LGIYLIGMLMWSGLTFPDSPTQDASRTAVTGSPSGATNPTDRTPPANPAYPLREDQTDHDTQAVIAASGYICAFGPGQDAA
jgi:hypothetical protein